MFAERATILKGPNGSGKTADLEAICRREDQKFYYIPSLRHSGLQNTGFARQGRAVPFLAPTVLGSLASSLILRGFCLKTAYQYANGLLGTTDSMHLCDRSLRHLSGGEVQIVNVLSAIVSAGDGLLLDDPFSMLDDNHRKALLKVLAGLDKYVPPIKARRFDILMTLTSGDASSDYYSWVRTKDFMEIERKHTADEQQALEVFVDMAKQVARERSLTCGIQLREFAVRIHPEKKPLFRPLTVTLAPKSAYALRAPNGAGKSLVLAALAGNAARNAVQLILRMATARVNARIRWEGHLSWPGCTKAPRRCVFVPQHSELLTADLGPKEEIRRLLGGNGKQSNFMFADELAAVGLDHRRIGAYSFGEARFFSVVVGLLTALKYAEVPWVFLDEIDARLDQVRRSVIRQMVGLFLASGGGVLEATHTSDLAANSLSVYLEKYAP